MVYKIGLLIELCESERVTEPNPKRHCGSSEPQQKDEEETALGNDSYPDESKEEQSFIIYVTQSGTLKKARNMAINLASKAAALASELKAVKSELCSVQGRCKLLEEENRRLRDGLENVVRPDEDDLVTLQLEALLAEKSKLARNCAIPKTNVETKVASKIFVKPSDIENSLGIRHHPQIQVNEKY